MTIPGELTVLLTFIAICGCGRSTAVPAVIASSGQFTSPDGAHTLTVQLTADDTVSYRVGDRSGAQVLAGNSGSKYHRWFFFWDNEGRLWVHNSDMGSSVWTDDGAKWTQHQLQREGPLLAEMPQEVKRNLPHSLKEHLGL